MGYLLIGAGKLQKSHSYLWVQGWKFSNMVNVCVCPCAHVCTYTHTHVHIDLYVKNYRYICVHVYVHTYVHTLNELMPSTFLELIRARYPFYLIEEAKQLAPHLPLNY